MRSSLGFLIRLKILLLLFLFNPLLISQSEALEEISQEASVYYSVDDYGKISFKYLIDLSVEPGYTTAVSKYTMYFPIKDLDFYTITSDGENLRARREIQGESMHLILDLDEKILNHSNSISIKLEGEIKDSLIKKVGNTGILTLPGSMSNINVTKAEISYPTSLGNITNFNDDWDINVDEKRTTIRTDKIGKVINLVWGDNITYDFEINKRLLNTANTPKRTIDINIPKSHNNQKIYFSQIDPIPNFAYQDAEGNLFFSYELSPNSEILLKIRGQIKISLNKNLEEETIEIFKKPILTETKGYWLLDDDYEINRLKLFLTRKGVTEETINEMDSDQKETFYKKAYDYVVERLKLVGLKTSSMESNIRQGANNTVNTRDNSAPEDYVDLLSAIYRKYGVPTRMVEGYTTIFNDGFYHTWLEFWDDEKGWRAIDPALEDYTKGNYYDVILPNHINILTRSYNYIRPRLTLFSEEEFKISLANNTTDELLSVENKVRLNPFKKAREDVLGVLKIKNNGNTIISMKDFTNQQGFIFSNHNALQIIVPGQTLNIPFVYKPATGQKEKVYLEYQSINGNALSHPVNLNIQEQSYWWWNLFVITLKYTTITLIVYILYLIFDRIFKWIEKYYQ